MRTVPLADICSVITDGTHASPIRTDAGVPVLSAQNVQPDGLDEATDRFTTEAELDAFERRFRPSRGDVLMTIVGTIGRVTVLDREPRAVFQRSVAFLRPKRDLVDSRFLALASRSPSFRSQLARATNQSSQAGVYLSKLKRIELPLPPLTEQRRIAAILDQTDALRAQRRQVLAHLDTLIQSIFHDMMGARNWPCAPLAEVVRPGTIVTYGIVQAGKEYPGGVPYIRTGDLVGGRIAAEDLRHTDPTIAARFERSTVAAGDIVMSIRATVGTTAVVPDRLHGANLTQGTARIAPGPSVLGTVLLAYLRSPAAQHWIAAQIKGATFREITLTRLRELPVPIPGPDVQRRFDRAAETAEAQKRATERALAADDDLFASLQSRAFRGEL